MEALLEGLSELLRGGEGTIEEAGAKPQSPEQAQRLEILKGINKAGAIIDPIIKEWSAWLTKHFEKRESYGKIPVPETDITILRFQVFQSKHGELGAAAQNKILPLIMAAKKTKDVASTKALLAEWKEYVALVLKLSQDIRDQEALMVADGLKDHNADIQAAYTALLLVV